MYQIMGSMRMWISILALAGPATGELFGIAGLALHNAISNSRIALGPLDLSGSVVTLKGDIRVVEGIHLLDVMDSGCGLAVAGNIAYTVGYDCEAQPYKPCPAKSSMRLYGVDLATGKVAENFSTPLPWWEKLDDHHTAMHIAKKSGDFVITGIMSPSGPPRPLVGGVVVMGAGGDVKSTQIIDQAYGDYIKGPAALDEAGTGGYSVYLAVASIGANKPLIRYDVATATKTEIPLPDNLVATSLAFDATRGGAWIVASNATKILEDGYYLAFVPRGAVAPSSVRALGRDACSSVSNPEDNAARITALDGPNLVVALTCQPSAGSLNQHLITIDVTTAKVTSAPFTYPAPLHGAPNATAEVFGIAASR